jgi:hypothetical protein
MEDDAEKIADALKPEHKVRVLSEDPWCVEMPADLLACDTWVLRKNQKKCRKGHKITYYT